jgi:hypothetical protein
MNGYINVEIKCKMSFSIGTTFITCRYTHIFTMKPNFF